jgi:TPR repeat protein
MMYQRFRIHCRAWPAAALLAALGVALPAAAAGPSAGLGGAGAPAALSSDRLMAAALSAYERRDYPAARSHLRLLAGRENATAETLLGTMSANGQGGAKDPAVAAAWFLRAARRGYAPAQLALADAFMRGSGVPADPARARALARAAAQQGQPGAAQLAARLGPERYAQLTGGRP